MTFKTGDKVSFRPFFHQELSTGNCQSRQKATLVPATVIDADRAGSGNVVVEFVGWSAPDCACAEFDRRRAIVSPRELTRR